MKGERAPKRLGVETNKTIARVASHYGDWKVQQYETEVVQRILDGYPNEDESEGYERVKSVADSKQPFCARCAFERREARDAHLLKQRLLKSKEQEEMKKNRQGKKGAQPKQHRGDPEDQAAQEEKEMLKSFNYKRDKGCTACLMLRVQTVTKMEKLEIVDHQENKRLARKGKRSQMKKRDSSSESAEEGEPEEEKKQDGMKNPHQKKATKKKYFTQVAAAQCEDSEEDSEGSDDQAKYIEKVTVKTQSEFVSQAKHKGRIKEDEIVKAVLGSSHLMRTYDKMERRKNCMYIDNQKDWIVQASENRQRRSSWGYEGRDQTLLENKKARNMDAREAIELHRMGKL